MNFQKILFVLVYLCFHHHLRLGHTGQRMSSEPLVDHQQHDADPHGTLSGVALVERLMEYCNNQIIENAKSEREHSRALTNDKIALVIKGFRDGISTLSKEITQTTARANDLADLELKMDTALVYQEQQLYNLKKGLQDTLLKIDRDMQALISYSQSCKTCTKAANSNNNFRDHIQCAHGVASFSCYDCSNLASDQGNITRHNLTEHYQYTQHSQHYVQPRSEQGCHCSICGVVLSDMFQLSIHLKHHHENQVFICNFCGDNFFSQKDLNHHIPLKHPEVTLGNPTPTSQPYPDTCSH